MCANLKGQIKVIESISQHWVYIVAFVGKWKITKKRIGQQCLSLKTILITWRQPMRNSLERKNPPDMLMVNFAIISNTLAPWGAQASVLAVLEVIVPTYLCAMYSHLKFWLLKLRIFWKFITLPHPFKDDIYYMQRKRPKYTLRHLTIFLNSPIECSLISYTKIPYYTMRSRERRGRRG